MAALWPFDALAAQAGEIGPALFQLIDSEPRWIHRRIERVEVVDAAQATRTVAADMTVPTALQAGLGLFADPGQRAAATATRFVVPLAVLPKGPLQDFTLTPADAHRLTAEQTNPLVLAALAPYARVCGASPAEVLTLAREIVRSERPSPDLLAAFTALLDGATGGDAAARTRLRDLVSTLDGSYLLLVAVKAEPGLPLRVTYVHRHGMRIRVGWVNDPPLIVEVPLPHASGPGPPYRVEAVAPDGLEIETASIVAVAGDTRTPVESENPRPGDGGFVHLRAPDAAGRPHQAALQVTFGWPAGGIHQIASIAGLASTAALLTATVVSYLLDEKMKGAAAGTLLAAPALVTSLALGFATTRVTSPAVNRLRLAALAIALLGVAGALTVSLLGENAGELDVLHGILIALTTLSVLVTGGYPLQAWLRPRAVVPLLDPP
jgi:hypothetical protein